MPCVAIDGQHDAFAPVKRRHLPGLAQRGRQTEPQSMTGAHDIGGRIEVEDEVRRLSGNERHDVPRVPGVPVSGISAPRRPRQLPPGHTQPPIRHSPNFQPADCEALPRRRIALPPLFLLKPYGPGCIRKSMCKRLHPQSRTAALARDACRPRIRRAARAAGLRHRGIADMIRAAICRRLRSRGHAPAARKEARRPPEAQR